MDFQTILILAQDGLTNSAIYVLLPLAMILIFGALVGFVALAMLQAIYGINLNAV